MVKDMDELQQKISKELIKFQKKINSDTMSLIEKVNSILMDSSFSYEAGSSKKRKEIPLQIGSSSKSQIPIKRKTVEKPVQVSSPNSKIPNKRKTLGQSVQIRNQVGSSSNTKIPNKRKKPGQSVLLLKNPESKLGFEAFSLEMFKSLKYLAGLTVAEGFVTKPLLNSYNKVIIKEGADPWIVKKLFSYGLIHSIYPSADLKEMVNLPSVIQNQVDSFKMILKTPAVDSKPTKVYIKCFSIIPEWDPKVETIHVVVMGTSTNEYVVEGQKTFDLKEEYVAEQIPKWRAQNIDYAYREMKKMVQESKKGYFCSMQEGILFVNMASQWKDKHLMERLVRRIENGEMEGSKKTLEITCKFLRRDNPEHRCGICNIVS